MNPKSYLLLVLLTISTSCNLLAQNEILDSARIYLGQEHFSKAFKKLNSIESSDPKILIQKFYLKAEVYLILGREKYFSCYEKLDSLGAKKEVNILTAKQAILLGDENSGKLVSEAQKHDPDNPELAFCRWLLALSSNDLKYCKAHAGTISKKILFAYAPYLALYYKSWDINPSDALAYLDTLESLRGSFYESKRRVMLELILENHQSIDTTDCMEIPYTDCGPGMGIILTDKDGNKISMELDTGTGFNLMTVHDSTKGASISGEDLITIEDGIQYNYMAKAEDMHYKNARFHQPQCDHLFLGYFKGQFSKADGCFSPFVFHNKALKFDPKNKKAWLLSQKAIESYKKENRSKITLVPYQLRCGWIFIPCKVNGIEILMMMETGSRDVNFNMLASQYLGLEVWDGTIKWRGQDYPVKKTNCLLQIGDKIKYQVKGGLISDFVLGNWNYGQASAGDLGPDFFRHFTFTINPFDQEIIFEH